MTIDVAADSDQLFIEAIKSIELGRDSLESKKSASSEFSMNLGTSDSNPIDLSKDKTNE